MDHPTNGSSEMSAAALQLQLQPYFPTFIFGVIVIFIWGYLWSSSMRDEEQQPLPPSFAANTFFGLSLCLLYVSLVIVGFLAPEFIRELNLPGINEIPEQILKQIPLVAIILMGAMYSIPQVKEVAQRYVILLHSAQYRKNDEITLQRYLQTCNFIPSQQELGLNIAYVRQFDVYITDREQPVIDLDSVNAWRKVSTLLRLLKDTCRDGHSCLNPAEREEVARLDEAHRRKTQLAMNIIRMVEQMDLNANVDQKLTRIAAQLSTVSHQDRARITSAEEEAREIVSEIEPPSSGRRKDDSSDKEAPLRLSMKQMNDYLRHIEGYFLTEYELILQDVTKLASKVILHAGDQAADRLESVKEAGFKGLGRIQRVSFDSVIWVLLSTFAIAFGGLTLLFTMMGRSINTSLVSSIALTISGAALIGAMWGSRRSLVEKRTTPWTSYFAAGMMAVAGFCLVHGTRFLLNGHEMLERMSKMYEKSLPKYIEMKFLTEAQAAHYRPEAIVDWSMFDYLKELLPFSLSAFFFTVGICWLARFEAWPWQKDNILVERLSDGVAAGLIYFVGATASTLLQISMKTGSGLRSLERINNPDYGISWLFFNNFRLMTFFIGFAIGALIIREVRHIAHVQLISDTSLQTTTAEEKEPSRTAAPQAEAMLTE